MKAVKKGVEGFCLCSAQTQNYLAVCFSQCL